MTIGAPVIKSLRGHTKAFLDMHMMVSRPEQWVSDFAKAGADSYTFHYEATSEPLELIKLIRKWNMKVGVAIKPKTDWQKVVELAPLVDMILVMTVEPGFGGQKFMADQMPKVAALRQQFPNLNIQVDGGVDSKTVHTCAAAGANVIVSGSGVFLAKEGAKHAISAMKTCVQSHIDKTKPTGSLSAAAPPPVEVSESAAAAAAARDVKSDFAGASGAASAETNSNAAASLEAERDRIWNRTPSDTDGSLQRLYRSLWSGSRYVGSMPKNSINL